MSNKEKDDGNRFEAQDVTWWSFISRYTRPTSGVAASDASIGRGQPSKLVVIQEHFEPPIFLLK